MGDPKTKEVAVHTITWNLANGVPTEDSVRKVIASLPKTDKNPDTKTLYVILTQEDGAVGKKSFAGMAQNAFESFRGGVAVKSAVQGSGYSALTKVKDGIGHVSAYVFSPDGDIADLKSSEARNSLLDLKNPNKGAQLQTLKFDGIPVQIASVHLDSGSEQKRLLETHMIMQKMQGSKNGGFALDFSELEEQSYGVQVFAGDLNRRYMVDENGQIVDDPNNPDPTMLTMYGMNKDETRTVNGEQLEGKKATIAQSTYGKTVKATGEFKKRDGNEINLGELDAVYAGVAGVVKQSSTNITKDELSSKKLGNSDHCPVSRSMLVEVPAAAGERAKVTAWNRIATICQGNEAVKNAIFSQDANTDVGKKRIAEVYSFYVQIREMRVALHMLKASGALNDTTSKQYIEAIEANINKLQERGNEYFADPNPTLENAHRFYGACEDTRKAISSSFNLLESENKGLAKETGIDKVLPAVDKYFIDKHASAVKAVQLGAAATAADNPLAKLKQLYAECMAEVSKEKLQNGGRRASVSPFSGSKQDANPEKSPAQQRLEAVQTAMQNIAKGLAKMTGRSAADKATFISNTAGQVIKTDGQQKTATKVNKNESSHRHTM